MSKVRALSNLLCGSCLALLLLPVGAQAAGRLEIEAPDRLPLGAEQVLELDGGTRSLDGAETVTVSGYLDETGAVPALTVGGRPWSQTARPSSHWNLTKARRRCRWWAARWETTL